LAIALEVFCYNAKMDKNYIDKIAKQRSKIQLLEIFVPLGRNKLEELERERLLLAEMELKGAVDMPFKTSIPTANNIQIDTTVKTMMDKLMAEHKLVRQAQAAKTNLLAFMPKHQNAKHLTDEIIGMAKKIEGIWDQYRNLQRYGQLNDPYQQEQKPELSATEKARQNQLKVDIASWQNIKQKAIAKLKNPQNFVSKNFEAKVTEWQLQLSEADHSIKNIKLELSALER
jgi:hypothetical protein